MNKQYILLIFTIISISLWFNTSVLGADIILIVNSGGTDDSELFDKEILASDRPGEILSISTAAIETLLAQDCSVVITASLSIIQASDATIDYQSSSGDLSLYTMTGDISIQNTIASGVGDLIISSGGTTIITGTITSVGDVNLNGEEININADININGNLTMTAATGITANTGPILSIMGTSTLTTSLGNINLNNVSNNFAGAVNASGSDVKLADANSIELGNIEATTLTVMSGIATVISAQSVINVTSSSTFATF